MKKKMNTSVGHAYSPLRPAINESGQQWLTMLLDAYEVFDRGVSLAIQRERRKRGRRPACTEGCSNCCRTQSDIPLYPLELAGIYWYVLEKIDETVRVSLKKNLDDHKPGDPCPFLIDHLCTVYPVRPAACRQFIVFGRRCFEGEDAFHTRRQDVMTPIKEISDQAFFIMLPFYGITDDDEKKAAITNNIIHARATNIMTSDWKPLAQRIAETI